MYLDFEVEIPALESGISKKRIKGTTYIYYEHGRKYYSDKQYTVPQCTSIGKMCEDDPSMMNPNGNYLKFFPDAELPDELPASTRSGCLKIGAWLVIKKVIKHYKLDERMPCPCTRAGMDRRSCSEAINHILEAGMRGYIMMSPHTVRYLSNSSRLS